MTRPRFCLMLLAMASPVDTPPLPPSTSVAEAWRAHHREMLSLAAIGFLVLASYATARPACESLFLAAYSSAALPYVWIGVALGATLAVWANNALAARLALVQLLRFWLGAAMAVLIVLLGAAQAKVPGAPFALYIWKDIYIVVLVESFWAYANCIFSTATARYFYGAFAVIGALGGIAGNLGIGQLARRYGTMPSLLMVVTLLALTLIAARSLDPTIGPQRRVGPRVTWRDTTQLLARSRYVALLLALVVIAQLLSNLVDLRFSQVLEQSFPDTDARTAATGHVYAAIELGSLGLQLTSSLVLRLLGVGGTLVSIPGLVALALGLFVAAPAFATAALLKVTGKALDYSLFRIAKEMLYIPLSYAEKTQGKAVVDVFGYRVAKAVTAAFIMALALSTRPAVLNVMCALFATAWMLVAWRVARRGRREGGLAASPTPLANP